MGTWPGGWVEESPDEATEHREAGQHLQGLDGGSTTDQGVGHGVRGRGWSGKSGSATEPVPGTGLQRWSRSSPSPREAPDLAEKRGPHAQCMGTGLRGAGASERRSSFHGFLGTGGGGGWLVRGGEGPSTSAEVRD